MSRCFLRRSSPVLRSSSLGCSAQLWTKLSPSHPVCPLLPWQAVLKILDPPRQERFQAGETLAGQRGKWCVCGSAGGEQLPPSFQQSLFQQLPAGASYLSFFLQPFRTGSHRWMDGWTGGRGTHHWISPILGPYPPTACPYYTL